MIAPYCSVLRERQRHGNMPRWLHIHVGENAWSRAKDPSSAVGDCIGSVWDGVDYDWPVDGCFVRVEIRPGPSVEQCQRFATDLLRQGAYVVLLWWFDRMPLAYYQDRACELDLDDLRSVFTCE